MGDKQTTHKPTRDELALMRILQMATEDNTTNQTTATEEPVITMLLAEWLRMDGEIKQLNERVEKLMRLNERHIAFRRAVLAMLTGGDS